MILVSCTNFSAETKLFSDNSRGKKKTRFWDDENLVTHVANANFLSRGTRFACVLAALPVNKSTIAV
jgi:hypothetical protein